MNKDNDIDEQIEKTLSSLNEIGSANPNPFFYTRLKARMEGERKTSISLKWSMAAMGLLLILNVFSIWNFWSSPVNTEDSIDMMAEYSLTENDIYSTIE